jgi:hypothetical protein
LIWLTRTVVVSEGLKAENGTIMLALECRTKLVTVADPREIQSLTPATTKEASDVLINWMNCYEN